MDSGEAGYARLQRFDLLREIAGIVILKRGSAIVTNADAAHRVENASARTEQSSRKWPVSTDGGASPVWRRDGHELYFRSGDSMMAARIETHPEFSIGQPQQLFRLFKGWSPGRFSPYDVAPDGRFLMIRNEPQNISQLNLVLNWFEELKAGR